MNSDTNQTELKRDKKGKFAGGRPPAGFNVHPENRSDGGWKKEDSIGYQYRMLQRLTVEELEEWIKQNPKNIRTVAQDLAYKALVKAQRELPYLKEVTDRSEGRAPQAIDLTSGGDKIVPVTIVDLGNLNANIDQAESDSSSDQG